jgi:hypothetical protein
MRFDQSGEAFLAAYSGDVLAGVGGITADPVIPEALRMRRFYVRPMFRPSSIGRSTAIMLLERAQVSTGLVTLNAAPNSFAFWEALGFVLDLRAGYTHVWQRGDRPSSIRDHNGPGGDKSDT